LRRAVLEGVALAIRHNCSELGGIAGTLPALGGGAANPEWTQILADILGHGVTVPAMPVAATGLGVGKLAARALGWPEPAAPGATLFQPRPAQTARADRLFARYLAASAFARAWATS
jgi:sugar (pentulose or hexulose) kinase